MCEKLLANTVIENYARGDRMTLRAGVLVFPGSNCDRDLAVALRRAGAEVEMVWHKETALPAGLDLVAIPGGFSFGDYLRCGAIAARAPVMRAVVDFAEAGGHVLGVCNGFQVLIEAGLLPGALMRNAGLQFVCAPVGLDGRDRRQRLHPRLPAAGEVITPADRPPRRQLHRRRGDAARGSRTRTASPSATSTIPNGSVGGHRRRAVGQPPGARA